MLPFSSPRFISRTCAFACVALLLGQSPADTVLLKNGDRISGTVSRMKDGSVQIKTSYAGSVNIAISQVQRIVLDSPAPLLNQEGKLTTQKIFGAKTDVDPTPPYPIADVKILFPTVVDLGEKGSFSGHVNLALKLESGNSPKNELDTDFNIEYLFLKHKFSSQLQFEYDYNKSASTKQDWTSGNKYSYFYTPKYFLSYWYALKQEKYDGLELRQTTGPGWGYKFQTSPRTYSTTEYGLYYVHENYTGESSTEYISANWILNYETLILEDKLRFYHRHQAGLSLEDLDKQLWHSWTGFRIPLLRQFITSIEYEIDFDSSPDVNESRTKNTLRIKLGKEW
ncbi:DUF481 domain-containing protein [Kiritimatiellaeota bacterium B1221]|nr:DUF481 domain-containing protein [Kiritimatiellaeota bacterium B1221]